MKVVFRCLCGFTALSFMLAIELEARAQGDLAIYTDKLVNGFQDWSWASHDLNNTSPVHSGTKSISVSAVAWQGLSFWHSDIDSSTYTNFSFWAHGGATGGQVLQVYGEYGTNAGPAYTLPNALPANAWQSYTIPLETLGVANKPNFNRITIQLRSNGSTGTFYVDDVGLTALPPPPLVHVQVDATQTVRTVDNRWFGANTAVWDGNFEKPQTVPLIREMGLTTLRFPGGSLSDQYHWASGTSLTNTWKWVTSFADFANAATNVGAEVFITVNYGTGTPEEAAAWVRHANATNALGFKYWEIGNENYGTWEADDNTLAHHAYTYATRAQQYIAQMKAADPSIRVGVVAVPGEDSNQNGYTDHPAYNPRTGETHYGWTPVLLTTLKNLGVTPDFLVHHHYPQWTNPDNPGSSPDNDATLLQSTGNWTADAADLRRQIEDYFGAGGTNIELVVTENNSDAGVQGQQSTSLVNGLYYADSLGELMKTEFNAFIWWDLRNSTDTNGYFGPEIYGWRDYGDLGMLNGLDTRHPTFYAAKLMQYFARGGDNVVQSDSDYSLLACHAVRKTNGALTLLVLNKSLTNPLNAEINLNGFKPAPEAAVHSFGIPQDEAARTNASLAEQDIAVSTLPGISTNFTYGFPPLSMTVFTVSAGPEGPVLVAGGMSVADEFVVELRGQPGLTYAIQSSSNLLDWTSVSTNTLSDRSVTVTNPVPLGASRGFWRAVWQQ